MSFWQTASLEQKLAQIDGGIELQMTSHQVALNLGTTAVIVRACAARYDRSFRHSSHAKPWQKKPRGRQQRRVQPRSIFHREDFNED